MSKNIQYEETFSRKFKLVFRELDLLEAKIDKTTGSFFTSHVYTVEELLKSDHHHKIYSIVEKIGSDVVSWDQNGQLDQSERDNYNNRRDKIEKRLDAINRKVIDRQPTWWEKVRDAFTGFVRIISGLLPKLASRLINAATDILLLPPGKDK